jgi:hypothetical protein
MSGIDKLHPEWREIRQSFGNIVTDQSIELATCPGNPPAQPGRDRGDLKGAI